MSDLADALARIKFKRSRRIFVHLVDRRRRDELPAHSEAGLTSEERRSHRESAAHARSTEAEQKRNDRNATKARK